PNPTPAIRAAARIADRMYAMLASRTLGLNESQYRSPRKEKIVFHDSETGRQDGLQRWRVHLLLPVERWGMIMATLFCASTSQAERAKLISNRRAATTISTKGQPMIPQ